MLPRLSRPLLGALLVVLTLTACASNHADSEKEASQEEGPDSSATAELPDPLTPLWSDPDSSASAFPAGDLLVRADDTGLRALDPQDGSVAWDRDISDLCTLAEPNPAGDLVVTAGDSCRQVVFVHGDTGRIGWSTTLPLISKRYDDGNVVAAIGDRSVTVIQFCGQVTRLSQRDGSRLGEVLAPHDRKCGNEADSDGQLIALWHDPETAATPDGHGTGFIPPHDSAAALELYDADSGELLWRRVTESRNGGLGEGAIVSADPLILAVEEDGHTTLRAYSDSGRAGPHLGRRLDSSPAVFSPHGVSEGVLVGTYLGGDTEGLVSGIDLATGEELWVRENPEPTQFGPAMVAGVDATGVVVTYGTYHADAGARTWVERWDPHTGEDAGVAGWLPTPPGTASWQFVDGLLLGTTADAPAFEVPASDPDLAVPDGVDGWTEADVRPDPLADTCGAVRPRTLRQLGLHASTSLPTPADCTWVETAEPDYSERQLQVRLVVAEPELEPGAEDTTPASEQAEELVQSTLDGVRDDGTVGDSEIDLETLQPVDGVGDEAYAAAVADSSGSVGASVSGRLVLRVGNVVADVSVDGSMTLAYRHAAPPSLPEVEAGLLAAARDAMAAVGVTLDVPDAPHAGRYTRIGDVCALLEADVSALDLPAGSELQRPGHDPLTRHCAWWQGSGDTGALHVNAYATADSAFSGKDAAEVAADLFERIRSNSHQPLAGLGDRAVIYRDDATEAREGYDNSDRRVLALVDNVVIDLEYQRWGAGVGDRVEADALRLARKVLEHVRKQR